MSLAKKITWWVAYFIFYSKSVDFTDKGIDQAASFADRTVKQFKERFI